MGGQISWLDWLVLAGTLCFIVVVGVWKSRKNKELDGFLRGGNEASWLTVGLGVMATQASAITFLSTPGQGFADGMEFVQFYYGLPIAMIILCITFIPLYYKLKVYTAYEFLENRFDLKTRSLTSFLFLIQRGLAAGITIYAPAIILSTIMGWHLNLTCIIIGILVIVYTVSGGTKAVNVTQRYQMMIIMGGMFLAFYLLIDSLPGELTFANAWDLADLHGKTQALDFSFDPNNRYTFWSGITGGLFLALAYFGTDQSQVQRYISGQSIRQSQMGLIFNAIFKIPMQYFILLTGVMVFVFYQFYQSPLFFNPAGEEIVKSSEYAGEYSELEQEYAVLSEQKSNLSLDYLQSKDPGIGQQIIELNGKERALREEAKTLISQADPIAETNDKDYVFINFIIHHLPKGVIGLLLAVIFSAAMSSTAAELNALATTSVIDIYKRTIRPGRTPNHYLRASKTATLLWGLLAILFATFGTLFENLIQLVNIIGSIFYGTILGIFLVAFYIRFVKANAVFIAAVIAETVVVYLYFTTDIGFLWFNVIGCGLVVLFAMMIQGGLRLTSPR
ncbi:sodium:solute symporter [Membranihabitans marinus]|uniref:sodium:solute symporter n=1 Tax=Membranihabitans marinus TaxID=1227546 RepID=UPI0021BD82DB|nr:sodium:solute symporter [Membranihabitans marinus]